MAADNWIALIEPRLKMCYSAEVEADYRKFLRLHGAVMDIHAFYDEYWRKAGVTAKIKTPKAMDAAFAHPTTDQERAIKALIDKCNAAESTRLEQDLFTQRRRLADANRSLETKVTKKATEDVRIATSKVTQIMQRLADIARTELLPGDSRIFPGMYAPVMVSENGRRVVKPMRYQCRPAGKPEFYDRKYPGTYNARRDNLEGFWKELFGHSHGIMIVRSFYENVAKHKVEHRELQPGEKEENVVLQFEPDPPQDMLVACLWSRWTGPELADLLSFAAITDDPPAEVAAAGHDRCIIPIKAEHIDRWLNPDPANLREQYDILTDRPAAYYEHRLAA